MRASAKLRTGLFILLTTGWCGSALALSVSLSPDLASPRSVDTVVRFEATATGADPANLVYRFDLRTPDTDWRLRQDFRARNYVDWSTLKEDTYIMRVQVRDNTTGETAIALRSFRRLSPGVITNNVVVRPTAHPQVVLFSAPPCPPGASLRVRYWNALQGPPGVTTHPKPCRANRGVNHYVAGLVPNSNYAIRGEIIANGTMYPGSVQIYSVGAQVEVDADVAIIDAADATTSYPDGVLVSAYITGRPDGMFSLGTNLAGDIIWSLGKQGTVAGEIDHAMVVRPIRGGTFMVLIGEVDGSRNQYLAEIDLVGNILRETNAIAVSEQLIEMGQDPIGSFHHEARPLANGRTLVLGSVERILTDVQGRGDVNVYGEMVVDLDSNFRVRWVWNAFEKLDNSDVAILGETCVQDQGGCPPLFLGEPANDWLHMNAIAYAPDGNLVLSARHQDAVYKIDYANGNGSGDVIWELGEHGNFTLEGAGSEVWPWFSHAHDSQYQGQYFVIFDNGNTRRDTLGEQENSRGQVFELDEVNMTATLIYNFDLGGYSLGLGSAELLANGNFHFSNGFLGTFQQPTHVAQEISPENGSSWVLGGFNRIYRSFRMRTLYEP